MNLRKTKIICTLGPATDDDEVLRKLMIEGMDVARFNFRHVQDLVDQPQEEVAGGADFFQAVRQPVPVVQLVLRNGGHA